MIRQLVAMLLVAGIATPAEAITGGVSAEEALQTDAGAEVESIAAGVLAVTVPMVRVDPRGGVRSFCTTTLIHPRVVLTAAHCVYDGSAIFDGLQVLFTAENGAMARRMALDVIVHPGLLAEVQKARGNFGQLMRKRGFEVLMYDMALVLLHRPAPGNYDIAGMVDAGFRDDRGIRKVIAGYGKTGFAASVRDFDLRFASLRGNTRDYRGLASGGGSEILMESYYQDGAKVNVCSGDSGGPVFVRERGGSRLRQIAVTSAADGHCREYAIFAPIDAQRHILRRMFDALMQGEQGAEQNPF